MTNIRMHRPLTVLLVGGVTMGSVLLGMGSASAAPDLNGPLINTTCSFAQIKKAAQKESPELAGKLAKHPEAEKKFEAFFALPPEQRKAKIAERMKDPKTAERMKQWKAEHPGKPDPAKKEKFKALSAKIAQTCHSF